MYSNVFTYLRCAYIYIYIYTYTYRYRYKYKWTCVAVCCRSNMLLPPPIVPAKERVSYPWPMPGSQASPPLVANLPLKEMEYISEYMQEGGKTYQIYLISSHLISSHLISPSLYIHTYIHYITLHSIPFHSIPLHYITFHSIPLHYITLHYITYIHTYIYIYACTCMYKYRYPVRRRKTLPGWLAVPGFHLFYDDWHSPQLCWMLIRALLMFRAAPSSRFPSCSNWARPTIAFAIR